MMEFTIMCAIGVLVTVVIGLYLRTPLFKMKAFWISYAIVLFFEVWMDAWLTKLSAPIIIYDESFMTNIRFPFDIPIEDFIFAIPLVFIPLMLWLRSDPKPDAN